MTILYQCDVCKTNTADPETVRSMCIVFAHGGLAPAEMFKADHVCLQCQAEIANGLHRAIRDTSERLIPKEAV